MGGFVSTDAATGAVLRPFPKVAGSVGVIVSDGSGGWYVGGEFTAVSGEPRNCLAQIHADGSVSEWNPKVTGSPGYIDPPLVSAIARLGDRIYVGGGFRKIGDQPRMNLGCVDARTGAVLDWNPGTHVDGLVSSLAVHDSTVFVGGWFGSVGGQPRTNLAAVDATTGVVRAWLADANGAVLALHALGDSLWVAGEFGWIAGWYRNFLAVVDGHTGRLLPFDAHADFVYIENASLPAIRAMQFVGDTLYVGGNFTRIGGQPRATLAALNALTGEALAWVPPTFRPIYQGLPPNCYVLTVKDSMIYVGGNFTGVGTASRRGAAALNRRTAELTGWDPRPDLPIFALAATEHMVYAGGLFSLLGDWTHRAGLAAIDLTTGTVKPWNPNPNGVIVNAIAVHRDRVFVSGDFTAIGGDPQPRRSFAALDTLTGLTTDWNPGANSVASALVMSGDTLYAGGWFTEVGGQQRSYLAAINATNGEVLPWDPSASLPVLTMTQGQEVIYVGGLFDRVGGQPRGGLAAVDPASGALTPWDPGTDNHTVDALLTTGDKVYVGGGFGMIGGQPRNAIAALDAATGLALPWNPSMGIWGTPARVHALALADSQLYAGGSFGSMGGQPRICLAALDTATGLATDWDPGLDGLVWSLTTSENTLYVGGGFSRAGLLPAGGLAAFSLPQPLPPIPTSLFVSQSMPNPARSNALIRLALPVAGPVTLTVYDIQGRRVATLLDHVFHEAGSHDVPVQTDRWKPGVYLYRVETGGRSAARKFVVVK